MKVTGHADSEMIRMYDKSVLADNASKKNQPRILLMLKK